MLSTANIVLDRPLPECQQLEQGSNLEAGLYAFKLKLNYLPIVLIVGFDQSAWIYADSRSRLESARGIEDHEWGQPFATLDSLIHGQHPFNWLRANLPPGWIEPQVKFLALREQSRNALQGCPSGR